MPKRESGSKARQHAKELLFLFSVPIGIIAVIIAFVYIPRLFASPSYDFVYCEGYYCDNRYNIDPSGKITSSTDVDRGFSNEYVLRYYDVDRDTTRPLHIDEAIRYKLDPTSKSPDDYTLQQSTSSGGFLFWDSYNDNWALKKGLASKPVTFDTGSSSSKQFVGWVIE